MPPTDSTPTPPPTTAPALGTRPIVDLYVAPSPRAARARMGTRWALRIGEASAAAFVLLLMLLSLAGTFDAAIPADAREQPLPATPAAGPGSNDWTGARRLTISETPIPIVETYPGSVAAVRSSVISARITARVAEISARPGVAVHEGDVLVRLDARDLAARVQEAQEVFHGAAARLTEARAQFNRVDELVADDVVTRAAYDAALASLTGAEANARGATNALEAARVAESHATIRAPFDAIVIDRRVDQGDTVRPGEPLVELYDPTRMRLEAFVRESRAVRLAPGDALAVDIESVGHVLPGIVSAVVPRAEIGARSFLVKVEFDASSSPSPIYPGLFGRLRVDAGSRDAIRIPSAAITRVGQLDFVRMAGTRGGNFGPRRMVVTSEPTDAIGVTAVEVLSGLRAGEVILVRSGPTPEGPDDRGLREVPARSRDSSGDPLR